MKSLVATTLAIVLTIQIINIEGHISVPQQQLGTMFNIAHTDNATARPVVFRTAKFARYTEGDTVTLYQSVVFTGDILLARNVEEIIKRTDPSYPFAGVSLSELAPNAAVVGNFESAISPQHKTTRAYTMRFSTDPQNVAALKAAGLTHLSLANNHSLDFGESGYNSAAATLRSNDLETFGCQNRVACNAVSHLAMPSAAVAVIGLEAVTGNFDREQVSQLLKAASADTDIQVVYIHWGDEYNLTHSKQQRALAEFLVANGADLIVGHHPHVVQGVELVDGVPVFYSLGNYIFDQYFSTAVQEGLLVTMEIYPQPLLKLVPVSSIGNLSQPHLLRGDDKAEFLYALSRRSSAELAPFIARGEIPLPNWLATKPKTAMMHP